MVGYILRAGDVDHKILFKFKSKVDRRGDDECWEWIGPRSRTKFGHEYGSFSFGGLTYKAHRVAYFIYHGSIDDGLTIDHLCRNKLCCNPRHLEQVTQSENTLRYWRTVPKPSVCKRGHDREPGKPCKRCAYEAVRRSVAKNRDKYREMGRESKRRCRQRTREAMARLGAVEKKEGNNENT